jgi:hypothetical protein
MILVCVPVLKPTLTSPVFGSIASTLAAEKPVPPRYVEETITPVPGLKSAMKAVFEDPAGSLLLRAGRLAAEVTPTT